MFVELVPCYALTNKLSDDEFSSFIHPSNGVARVLLSHFLMLNAALEVYFLPGLQAPLAFCTEISCAWVLAAAGSLPGRFRASMVWPVGMAASCDKNSI